MKFNSTELRGFLTGLIIGDGTIDKGVSKRAFRIKSINKEFIDLIKKELEDNTNFKLSVTYVPQYFRNGCNHKEYWELSTEAHPYFRKLYSSFYDDYRNRRITSNITKWLTPYGIANWYMSDGYICLVGKTKGFVRDRRVDFCTDAYPLYQVEMLKDMFKNRFNIKCSIIKRGKFYRLRVCKESYNNFFSLISKYIVPTLQYKLYLGYEKQPIWMSDEMWNKQVILSAVTLTGNAEG